MTESSIINYWREIGVSDVVRLLTPPGRARQVDRKRVALLMRSGKIKSWCRQDSRGHEHWFTTEQHVVAYLQELRENSLHFSTAQPKPNSDA